MLQGPVGEGTIAAILVFAVLGTLLMCCVKLGLIGSFESWHQIVITFVAIGVGAAVWKMRGGRIDEG
jgi:hypothetical protein